MAHPEIINDLSYQLDVLHLADRDGVPAAVAVAKATYTIEGNRLVPAETQQPVLPAGEYNGEPAKSSFRYEPECAYFKPNTDVVLIANAIPPQGTATQLEVSFAVGRLRKSAIVSGDRFWYRGFAASFLIGPEPFSEMPLIYERCFGGLDRSNTDPDRHHPHPCNPLGCGFQKKFAAGDQRLPLPNVESPHRLVREMGDSAEPWGFGFIHSDWSPRSALAGTFDAHWRAARMPLLPLDFDLRFFNAASPGLIAEGYLTGAEPVYANNCSAIGPLRFDLPAVGLPEIVFRIAGSADQARQAQLDTVVVNAIDMTVVLTWRCFASLPRGPEFLRAVHLRRGA